MHQVCNSLRIALRGLDGYPRAMTGDEIYVELETEELVDWTGIRDYAPWWDGPVELDFIQECIDKQHFESSSYSGGPKPPWYWTPIDHMKRIAYLVVHKDDTPVDVEISAGNAVVIHDGNHRLLAALVRGDKTIKVSLSGYVDEACTMFAFHCNEIPDHVCPERGYM